VPYHLEKVVPVHNPVPVPYQIEQQVKDLWFDRNERAVATKLAAVTVQGLVFEPEDHIRTSPQRAQFRNGRRQFSRLSQGEGKALAKRPERVRAIILERPF
jgi:hypothetical protein